jgi:hypothetical protein
MSVEELSQRLDQRFALLTDGSRAALPRHRTLRSTIDWSYDLLTDVEQAMLRRVSVFAGGWTLAAAEHVCSGDEIESSNTIDLLTSLADKNLVSVEEHDGTTRYRMLETIRQYAFDRLREADEQAQWRNRHFVWILALAEESFQSLIGPQQGLWIDRMASELDNFRAALQWAIDQKLADGFRLAHRGRPMSTMNNTAWKRVRREAGLCAVRIHDLRHTFGCRLRAAGVSAEDREALLGRRSFHGWPLRECRCWSPAQAANLVLNRQETRTVLRVANARESVLWIKGPATIRQPENGPRLRLVSP